MNQTQQTNRRIVLNSRPYSAPVHQDFQLENAEIPETNAGEVLLRTVYLSLDPYMRGRMSDTPSYCVSDGAGLMQLGKHLEHPSLALGVLGMPGFTAYMGLLDIGQPQAGETVVMVAATGAVGSVVGQIAKLKDCRVVGVAGGPDRCQTGIERFGFDACVDHHEVDFSAQLTKACPMGIDVYFESVGGKVFDAVLPLLNAKARVPVCGLIAHYNDTELPSGPDWLPLLMQTLLIRRIKAQGFIIFDDYGSRYGEFVAAMEPWVKEGKVKFLEDVIDGLENAPEAFIGLLTGKNFGKLVIRVGIDALE